MEEFLNQFGIIDFYFEFPRYLDIKLSKVQHFLPHYLLSKIIFRLANSNNKIFKDFLINLFVKHYKINLARYKIKNKELYQNVNHFFTRELDLGSQQLKLLSVNNKITSPAEGTIIAIDKITNNQLYQAKNKFYSLSALLGNSLGGNDITADLFNNGSYFTIYLSPSNYHRVHMPCSGKLIKMIYIPGRLFSVNNHSCNNINNIFARNERVINLFKTDDGYMAVILVGALLVGSIVTKWHGIVTPPHNRKLYHFDYANQNIFLNQFEELGHFQMGSTVIALFSRDHGFNKKLLNTTVNCGEFLLSNPSV